jgi:hypothetical protein
LGAGFVLRALIRRGLVETQTLSKLLGVWFLFRDEISFDLGQAWPVLAVALGVLMVFGAFIPRRGS